MVERFFEKQFRVLRVHNGDEKQNELSHKQ